MKGDFEDYFFSKLKSLGWKENCDVSEMDIENIISNEGYQIFQPVILFFKKFWNSKILFANKRNGLKDDDINFSFLDATRLEVPERINGSYALRIGKGLCLIGSAYREHMILMMSEDGYVYGGYDDFLCKIANSPLEAIEAIIDDKDFLEIK